MEKPLRAFYTRAAADKGLYYTENIAAKNFQAQLKAGDGSVTNIEAPAINNLSLSSVDKDGNSRVPNQEHFDDLVKFARKTICPPSGWLTSKRRNFAPEWFWPA